MELTFVSEMQISIIFRTVLIFLWALILLRFMGRQRLAHFTYTDLLLIIAFGSLVGDVMIYPEDTASFWTSFVALTTVTVLVRGLNELSSRYKWASKLLDRPAQMIIERGKVVDGALNLENLTDDDLLSLLRQHGVDAVHKVRLAYLEPDGELTVMPYKKYR